MSLILAVLLRALLVPSGEPVENGAAFRFETAEGPVRVWVPAHYDPTTAATVVYVHGYNRTPDSVWTTAALPRQFRESGRNALFIVPQVARNERAPLHWASVEALRESVARAGYGRPAGPLVLVGHSGAYRTLARWSTDPEVEAVVLLDGLYGADAAFARFAAHGRLVLVGRLTTARMQRFLTRFPDATRRDALPRTPDFTPDERRAPVAAFETTLGHAELNDGGAAIPVLLELALPTRRLSRYGTLGWSSSHCKIRRVPSRRSAGA
jgi:hypothetical protein